MTVQQQIINKLQVSFQPDELQVINESHHHNVPQGAESHFKVVLVSKLFESLRPIERQQKVYHVLAEEMAGAVHALTMQTLTPSEWAKEAKVTLSPDCMGGGR